jgi:predicted dehydrogenase
MTARSSTAPRLRVGLAGAGWVTAHHLDAWRQLADRATVVAIADPDIAAAKSRADAYDIPLVFDSVEAMLDATAAQLDALDVAAPREWHAPICRLAADRGLAILCQKPLAPTFDQAQSLVTDIGDRVRLMVHENWRFRPHYRRIAAWLAAGHIGDVRSASLFLLTSGFLPDAAGAIPALVRQPMLATLERLLVMEVLSHHIDTLRFLLGPLQLMSATMGRTTNVVLGEDRASLQLEASGGAPVSIVSDFALAGHPPQQQDNLEIVGTRGSISLKGDALRLVRDTGDDETMTVDLAADYRASYLGAISHFVDRLRDGGPFETAPDDNLETLRIVEAAYGMAEPADWRRSRSRRPT